MDIKGSLGNKQQQDHKPRVQGSAGLRHDFIQLLAGAGVPTDPQS